MCIYLHSPALEIVTRLMAVRTDGKLFRNARGNPWTKYAVCNRMHRLSRATGRKMALYDGRHGFATRKLVQGHDHLTIAELMGHRDGTMISQVYGHLDRQIDHLKKAAGGVKGRPPLDSPGDDVAYLHHTRERPGQRVLGGVLPGEPAPLHDLITLADTAERVGRDPQQLILAVVRVHDDQVVSHGLPRPAHRPLEWGELVHALHPVTEGVHLVIRRVLPPARLTGHFSCPRTRPPGNLELSPMP